MGAGQGDVLHERERESAALADAIAGTADGGSLVVVEGPPGIGKTRLLATARRRGRHAAATMTLARPVTVIVRLERRSHGSWHQGRMVARVLPAGPASIGLPRALNRCCSHAVRTTARLPNTPLHRKGLIAIVRRMTVTAPRQSQLLRGVLDACLLAVTSAEPAYGYEMTRRLAERGLAVADGSIYPALGRLERDGLVSTFIQAGNGGPPRKYYGITDAGRERLAQWSAEWRSTRSAIDAVLERPGEDG